MKNNKFFLGLFVGAIIFGCIGVYAGGVINSDAVTFNPENSSWSATTVDGALNDLYTYASSYKNLNQNTTFNAGDLAFGKTAYNKDGSLITGTHQEECATGTLIISTACTTSEGCVVYDGISPTKFALLYPDYFSVV